MQTLSEIRALLESRGVRPKHRFGQNFLHDQNQLRKLVAAADVRPDDLVLEVGPGTGTLSETLLEAGARLVACEIDDDMVAILESTLLPRHADRFTLLHADCLAGKRELNPIVLDALGREPFKLVANLPYDISSPLIATLLIHHAATDARPRCTGLFMTVQKEAADRIASPPGTREYGVLSILCQTLADVSFISRLSPTCFWPAPKVESAMIAIVPRSDAPVADRRGFADFLQRLFNQRRKQLGAILGRGRAWPNGVDPAMRPEALPIPALVALHRAVAPDGGDADPGARSGGRA